MSYYEFVKRWWHRSDETKTRYKLELWRTYHGYLVDIIPVGGNEPLHTVRSGSPATAIRHAENWVDVNR